MTENNEIIRTFIAIPISADICKPLLNTAHQLVNNLHDVKLRWVSADNIHLTLFFLGHQHEKDIRALIGGLNEQLQGSPSFQLNIESVSPFPNKRPHVIAANLSASEKLGRLHSSIVDVLARQGFEPERRPFSPHITLARSKNPPKARSALKQLEPMDIDQNMPVDKIIVYKSLLESSGAQHIEMGVVNLE